MMQAWENGMVALEDEQGSFTMTIAEARKRNEDYAKACDDANKIIMDLINQHRPPKQNKLMNFLLR